MTRDSSRFGLYSLCTPYFQPFRSGNAFSDAAVRDLLSRINPDEIRSIHEEMIDIIKRNRVFREGTIGGKRLIERLKKRHGHFADVIVADALYLNAPFINTLKENGLEGCPYKLRVVRYHEQWEENGKERERFM